MSSAQARTAKAQARDQYNSSQVDRLATINSAIGPRELVMGRVRKGGTVLYKASTGAYQKDLYIVLALAGHEIDAVESIYLNDVLVTLDGSGNVTTAPYYTSATISAAVVADGSGNTTLPATYIAGSVAAAITGDITEEIVVSVTGSTASTGRPGCTITYQYTDITSTVQIATHLGQAGQTFDPWLATAFPSDWSSDEKMVGVAYLVAKLTYSETAFPTGIPNITAVIRGAKLYDPRTGLTVWSENPALMMRHVYKHSKFGKATVTAAEDARISTAANACDTSNVYHTNAGSGFMGAIIAAIDATYALYRASLVVPFGADARSVFDDLAQAMGGGWAYAGGSLYCKAGVYTAPVLSLGESDLAVVVNNGASESQNPISISVHKERAQKFNTVKVKIWDDAQDRKQVSLTPLVGSALLARDGIELTQEMTFPAIAYAPQALHVAGVMMRDARDPLVVELPLKLFAYRLEVFDNVSVTLARYGWSSKVFSVIARSWNYDGTLKLTLKETSATITTVDAGFSAQGFAANTNLPSPWIVGDVGTLTVSSGTNELLLQNDGTIQSRMRITWTQVADISVQQAGQVEIQYRPATETGAWASLVVPGDETQVLTSEVQDGQVYTIRARAKTKLGIGDWGPQEQHQVIGKTAPPEPFDTFTVLAQPDGTRQYNYKYTTTAAPVDWLGAEIRYVSGTTSTPDWDTMTLLQDDSTYYTSSPVEMNAPLAGEYTFACKSVDTSGNRSTYKVVNITLPGRRLGNVFDEFFEGADGWLGTKSGCQIQEDILQSIDTTTWATLPATWDAWTRWNFAPTSPISYVSPVRDFGTVIAGQVDTTVDAVGDVVQEYALSTDGSTWGAWTVATAPFSSRYIKVRLTVTANGTYPVPVVRQFDYQITAPMRSEYLNDIDIAVDLDVAHRLGTGNIRIPLAGSYSVIKRTTVVVQDGSAGTWTYVRIDNDPVLGPNWQFRFNGTLADPAYVDFFVEGY
jgi:hypothetical protein